MRTIPRVVERVAKTGGAHAFTALVDPVIETHQQVRIFGCAFDVAQLGHLCFDQIGILRKFQPACQRRIVRDHGKGLALRRGKLALEA